MAVQHISRLSCLWETGTFTQSVTNTIRVLAVEDVKPRQFKANVSKERLRVYLCAVFEILKSCAILK